MNLAKRPVWPNFLLVGAAKAGTTSLYNYFQEHPEIFMCPLKEPNFFLSQVMPVPKKRSGQTKYVRTAEAYCRLFADVKGEKAIGEASVSNLYYWRQVIGSIKDFLGDPQILIILRNPVERAFSAYHFLIHLGRETRSFEEGLDQEERLKQADWDWFWSYREVGLYYRQVKAYLDNFSRVKVVLFDDLRRDAVTLMRGVYAFLGVDAGYSANTSVRYNASGVPKSNNPFLNFVLTPMPGFVRRIGYRLLTEKRWIAIREKWKSKILVKPQMKAETRHRLTAFYHEDILRLQELVGRDLSLWLNGATD